MSKSIKQLRQQNERLRAKIKAESELVNLEEERVKLGQQNKRLLKDLRRSPASKSARRTLRNIGRGAFIVGKSIGKNLVRYGKFLDKVERRNQRATRKIKRR